MNLSEASPQKAILLPSWGEGGGGERVFSGKHNFYSLNPPPPSPLLHERDNSIHLEEVKLMTNAIFSNIKKWPVLYELETSGLKTVLRHLALEQIKLIKETKKFKSKG